VKFKTRIPVFCAIAAVLVSLLFTCKPFASGDYDESGDAIAYTDVEYSPDGSSVTIYLDGSAPVRHSRALTRDLAVLGHDLFEVAFAYRSTAGQTTVARAVWETGHAAGINGVYRDAAGVDYSNVRLVSGMSGGQGSAILFVGKKSDRTLLAVGKLAAVDGIGLINDPPVAVPSITTAAKSVTFAVAALKAGVSDARGPSSFKTDANGGGAAPGNYGLVDLLRTEVLSVTIGAEPFPLFQMDVNADGSQYVHGNYMLEVVTANGDFDTFYRNGILKKDPIVVDFPILPSFRIPRYPRGKNDWITSTTPGMVQRLDVDTTTPVVARNNTAVGQPIPNPLQFEIGPTQKAMDGKVFAFTFEVPVYPLSSAGGRDSGFSWYIRPGYDSYTYDLDDGKGGTGGAILMGTGKFAESIIHSLYLKNKPNKLRYTSSVSCPLELGGMVLYLRKGSNTVNIPIPLGAPGPLGSDLYFVVHGTSGTRVIYEGYDLLSLFTDPNFTTNGALKILIRYYGDPLVQGSGGPPFTGSPLVNNPAYNGDDPYTDEFTIYYFDIGASGIDFDNIPPQNRFVIVNQEDFWKLQNRVVNDPAITDGAFIVVFFNNYDLGTLTLRAGIRHFVVMLAGRPDIIIGKSGANVWVDNSAGNLYYFGVWPFDEILSVQGTAINSEPFIVNAGGSWEDVTFTDGNPDPTTTTPTGYFISTGANKVVNDMGVTVVNRTRLSQ
jgi:hypothetical protein